LQIKKDERRKRKERKEKREKGTKNSNIIRKSFRWKIEE